MNLTGETRRDLGHENVAAADQYTYDWLRGEIRRMALLMDELTSDDLHDMILSAAPTIVRNGLDSHPNMLGAAIRGAASAFELIDTGRAVKTRRATGQARKITVWKSNPGGKVEIGA